MDPVTRIHLTGIAGAGIGVALFIFLLFIILPGALSSWLV